MTKQLWLTQVTRDVIKYGSVQDETKTLGHKIKCSSEVYNTAIYQGQKAREAIYEKHRYWQTQEVVDQARSDIRREMSCGHRLDTRESLSLIEAYHKAMDARDVAASKIDVELEAL